MTPEIALRGLSLAVLLMATLPCRALATGADTVTVPPVDPAGCWAAIAANDDDKVGSDCGALIDNEKTAKADRTRALTARAAVFARRDQLDRAISDYS